MPVWLDREQLAVALAGAADIQNGAFRPLGLLRRGLFFFLTEAARGLEAARSGRHFLFRFLSRGHKGIDAAAGHADAQGGYADSEAESCTGSKRGVRR